MKTSPNVLMVFPRFNPNSFWSLQAACDIWGARCPAQPNTQLSRRLKAEGRLLDFAQNRDDVGDQCTAGLNFVTLRPRQDILRDYKSVLEAVYSPRSYFERVRAVGMALRVPSLPIKLYPKIVPHDLGFIVRLAWRMTFSETELRGHFWRVISIARSKPRISLFEAAGFEHGVG